MPESFAARILNENRVLPVTGRKAEVRWSPSCFLVFSHRLGDCPAAAQQGAVFSLLGVEKQLQTLSSCGGFSTLASWSLDYGSGSASGIHTFSRSLRVAAGLADQSSLFRESLL